MNAKRARTRAEFLALYNRGEIGKEQFLKQEKLILQEEKAEQEAILKAANRCVVSLAIQIEEIEEELKK